MENVIITGYTAKSEGVILETNIPARLKPNRMPSRETFVSWDKIGKLLFENYTELEDVDSRDSVRNNSSPKEEFEKQYCMPDEVNTREEHEQYLKDIGYVMNSEELFGKHFDGLHYDDLTPEKIQKYAIEFARYHVEKALETAAENAKTLVISEYEVIVDASFILKAYPKDNVI